MCIYPPELANVMTMLPSEQFSLKKLISFRRISRLLMQLSAGCQGVAERAVTLLGVMSTQDRSTDTEKQNMSPQFLN